jgi:hypothetical protein
MQLLSSVFTLLDLPTFFGGHTYDFSGSARESSGGDGGGGIGTASIVAVLVVVVVAVGLLVSLNPSSARARLRTVGPAALMAVFIAAPLVLWAASSGSAQQSLIVERAIDVTGTRELLVNLTDKDLNTLRTTRGKRTVRVVCLGREGQVVLSAVQKWPFINEPGYDYPHLHQRASRDQLVQADRCRVRGTRMRLEAEVEGALN